MSHLSANSSVGNAGILHEGSLTALLRHTNGQRLHTLLDYLKDTGNISGLVIREATIAGGVDLNTLVDPGIYFQSSDANAESGVSYPRPYAGMLEVAVRQGSTNVYQRYTIYNTGEIFSRVRYAGTWYDWNRQWDSRNMGHGSGLVADKLDDLEATQFVRSDVDAVKSGKLTVQSGDSSKSSVLVVKNSARTDVAIEFNTSDAPQIGTFKANHLNDIAGPSGEYSYHFASTEAATNVILEGTGDYFVKRDASTFYRVVHQGHLGSGKGLDVDMVDGYHAAAAGSDAGANMIPVRSSDGYLRQAVLQITNEIQFTTVASASDPQITHADYQSTGFYFANTTSMKFSTDGVDRLTIDNNGVKVTNGELGITDWSFKQNADGTFGLFKN